LKIVILPTSVILDPQRMNVQQHQSQSIHRLKVGLYLVGTVDYKFVADGYTSPFSFV